MPNLKMDASPILPRGFHPVLDFLEPTARHKVRPRSRFGASKPVKYYYIDFGISVHSPTGALKDVVGTDGLDPEVPELSSTVPYDAFKVDIYILGNLFRKELLLVRVMLSVTCCGLRDSRRNFTTWISFSL